MGFRDDQLASRARVEVLEAELAEFRREKETPATTPTSPTSGLGKIALGVLLLAVLALLAAFVAGWRIPTHGDDLAIGLAFLAATLLPFAGVLWLMSRLLFVVPPGRILVVSGRRRTRADGSSVGYRVVTGGRTLKMPVIEVAEELATGPFRLDVSLSGVYLASGERADLGFRAVVSVVRTEPHVAHAIERFLGRNIDEIERVAGETLEGAIRNVASSLDARQLNEDRQRVTEHVLKEADHDFQLLGLSVETLHLLDVRQ